MKMITHIIGKCREDDNCGNNKTNGNGLISLRTK